MSGGDPGDIDILFHRERYAGQGAELLADCAAPIDVLSAVAGTVSQNLSDSIDFWIELGDALEVGVNHFDGTRLTSPYGVGYFNCLRHPHLY